ncbi:unnamed protein product [Musa hybrid cultivar]
MYGRNSSSIFWIVVLELQRKPTTDGIEDTTTAHEVCLQAKRTEHPGILYYLYEKKEKHNKSVNQSNPMLRSRQEKVHSSCTWKGVR